MIRHIQKTIPDLKYKSDESTHKPHEAKLLKLDISKALTHLDWRPLLNFEETIHFTIQGYLSENDGGDVYESRANQIKKYVAKF